MSDSGKSRSSAEREFDPAALRKLIDQFDDGIVHRAAKRIGISQPSLWKLLERQSQPKAQTIMRIARAYDVTTDWLYTSRGRAADDTFGQGVRYAVTVLRRELDQLEDSLGGTGTPLSPPPVGSVRDRAPVADPELFKSPTASTPSLHSKPKKGGRKRA